MNAYPVANAGADFLPTLEKTVVQLSGSGTDGNPLDVLSFSWQQLSGTAVVGLTGADTATPSFTLPDILVAETSVWKLVVTDPDGLASDPSTVEIPIKPKNNPPVVTVTPVLDTPEGMSVVLAASVVDPNEDAIVSVQWVKLEGPAGALSNPDQLMAGFEIPDIVTETKFVFELTATDSNGGEGKGQVTFYGLRVNQDPVACADGPASEFEGRDVMIDAGCSLDPDPGDQLEFMWTQTSGVEVGLMSDGMGVASFTAPETPEELALEFELIVNDDFGGEDRLTRAVTIQPDPLFPVEVIVRTTPGSAVVGLTPSVSVEVEVLARDGSQLIVDGTQVALSTTLGALAGPPVVGTSLGLVTTTFTPGVGRRPRDRDRGRGVVVRGRSGRNPRPRLAGRGWPTLVERRPAHRRRGLRDSGAGSGHRNRCR